MIQKSLPALSCLGVLHICGLAVGPGKHPSRFLSSVLGEFLLCGLRASHR